MHRSLLRRAACLAVFLTCSTQGLANQIVTDEFVSSPPDPSVWAFINPLGDGQHNVSGGQLSISVPAGVSHDPWTAGNDAPRLMQSVADQDFAVEIKLDSSVTLQYQMQGLIVEEDADTFIRFEVFSDGSRTRVYSSLIDNGSVTTNVNLSLGGGVGAPIYLRVSRTSDTWTYEYSLDGNAWQTATTFTANITMSAIGVHAGNFSTGSAPAHTAVFDYFKNLAAPPGPSYSLTTTVSGEGAVSLNPPGGTYAEGTVVTLTAVPDTGWQFDGWSGAVTGSTNPVQVTVNSDLAVQALFSQTPITNYNLTVTTSGSGSVGLSPPGGTYAEGTVVTLTAVPDAGWQFDGWSGAVTGSTNPVQVTVTSDLAVQALFSQVIPDYNLTVTTTGSGSVSLNPPGGTYAEGTVVALTAVPDTGWQFDGWSGAVTGSTNPVQVTVTSDLAVQALFSQVIPDYNLTVTTTGSGSVSLNPPGGTYAEGTVVALTAVPDTGWQFDGWSGAVTGSTNPVQVTVTSDLAVQALFSQVIPDYNLTVTTTGSGSVSLNPPGGTYAEGTVVALTAVPDTGWQFDGWSGAVTGSTNPVQVTVTSDLAVQALFSQVIPDYNLTVTTTGSGSVSLNPPGGTYAEGTVVALTAVPDTGWQFDGWSGAVTGSTNPVQVTVTSDLAVQALFSQVIPDYNLTVTTTGSGSVSLNPPGGTYAEGTVVALTAVPDTGWQFDGWSGAVTGSTNPVQVTVTSDLAVQALFSQVIPDYNLTVTTTGSGSVSLNPPGGTYAEGTVVALTAVPDAGWQFDGWSGAVTGSTNPVQVTVTSDLAVQALFSQVIPDYNLTVTTTGSGSVSLNPPGGTYAEGTVVALTAVPDAGWQFDSWSGDVISISNPVTVTVNNDLTISATFDPDQSAGGIVTDEFVSSPDPSVWTFVNPLGDGQQVVSGGQLSISVPAGVSHDAWTNGNPAPRLMQSVMDQDFSVEIKLDSSVTQNYQMQGFIVEEDVDTFVRAEVFSDGSGTRVYSAVIDNGGATTNVNTSLGSISEPIYLRLSRTADTWTYEYSLDGTSWQTATTFTAVITMSAIGVYAGNYGTSNSAPAHTAVYDYFRNLAAPAEPTYTVSTAVSGEGTVSKNPDQTSYESGSLVELTASPATGYLFDSWSGDLAGSNNPETITVMADTAVQANFVVDSTLPQYSLSVTSNGSGSVTLDPPGGTYPEGSTVTLTATPDSASVFDGWSGDLTGSTNPVTITITADMAVQANFSAEPLPQYSLSVTTSGSGSVTLDLPGGVYDEGTTVTLTATPDSGWVFNGWEGDVVSASDLIAVTMDSDKSISATFSSLQSVPSVNVWYGLNQTFGDIGVPQRWVNILGNVSDPDGLSEFSYSLNGVFQNNLSFTPFRRLEMPGDFNIDIDFADLSDGVNYVDITAVDSLGNMTIRTVEVNYPQGNTWPSSYSIDWSVTENVTDVAQIVDGLWEISNGELLAPVLGYDRLVAIGDVSWTDYEVTVPVTIYGIDAKGFESPNFRPGVGVWLKWPGHSNWENLQPYYGYTPNGGGAWYGINPDESGELQLTDFNFFVDDPQGRTLQFGTTYIWKVKVETQVDGTPEYSVKVWESTQTEPANWELVGIDNIDVSGGSLLLIAHYTNVRFGNIVISPLGE